MQGVQSLDDHPGARYGNISWVDSKGDLWLYGGRGIAKGVILEFGDLWKANTSVFAPLSDTTHGDSTIVIGDTSSLSNTIKLSPNPFTTILYVSSSKSDSVAYIKVFDINGILIKTVPTQNLTTPINLSTCKPGLYVIIAEDKHRNVVGSKLAIKQQ